MAITLADFNKIWAITSPLTPYSFSESNYKQGWNFIGSTPPARQMWDYLQKNNDEKMQYLANNYLPLSGGTMTGYLTMGAEYIERNVDNASLTLCGGTSYSNGAYVSLNGKDKSANAGVFYLVANDGTNSKSFKGNPDGTLTWGGNNVITSAITGNIISAEANVELPADAITEICRVTVPVDGIYLIIGYSDLASSVNGTCYVRIDADDPNASVYRIVRYNGAAGGGDNVMNLSNLRAGYYVILKGYSPSAVIMRGVLRMVRLA